MISFNKDVPKMISVFIFLIFATAKVIANPIEQIHSIAFPKFIEPIKFESDGEHCPNGQICKSFKDCDIAVKLWNEKRTLPETCRFEGKEQFVCCEGQDSVKSGSLIKKSKF